MVFENYCQLSNSKFFLGNTLTPDRNKAYKLKLDKFERSADRS